MTTQISKASDQIIDITSANVRRQLTDEGTIKVGARTIHVGDGLDQMTSLLQMVEHANEAGAKIPKIVMRDADNRIVAHWRQSEIREILEAVAARENIVENAHNAVMADYHAETRIRDDETLDLEERESAAERAALIAQEYEGYLQAYIIAHDPDELPDDLEERKDKLSEHLEADALAHVKMIRGALTRQRLSLPAACDDMANAEKKVAREQMFGQLQIMRSASNGDADREYKIAKSKIASVKAAKVPEFTPTGGDSSIPSNRITFKLNSLNLTVRQEEVEGLPFGRVAVSSGVDSLSHGGIRTVQKTDNQIDMVLSRHGEHTARFAFIARNLCGFNRLEVHLQPPASDS